MLSEHIDVQRAQSTTRWQWVLALLILPQAQGQIIANFANHDP